MDFKLKVIGNQSAIQTKQERGPDQQVKTVEVKTAQVVLRGDDCQMRFATDYEIGKTFELGSEVTVTIPD